jgi:hypothetical protein
MKVEQKFKFVGLLSIAIFSDIRNVLEKGVSEIRD